MDQKQVERLMEKINQKFSEQTALKLAFKEEVNARFEKLESRLVALEAKRCSPSSNISINATDLSNIPPTESSTDNSQSLTLSLNGLEAQIVLGDIRKKQFEDPLNTSSNPEVPIDLVVQDVTALIDVHAEDIMESVLTSLCAEHTPDSVVQNALHARDHLDSPANSVHNAVPIRKEHMTVNALTILRGFAHYTAAMHLAIGAQYKVWKPGLSLA